MYNKTCLERILCYKEVFCQNMWICCSCEYSISYLWWTW